MKNYFFFMLALLLTGTISFAQPCSAPTNVQIQRTAPKFATINAQGSGTYDLYLNEAPNGPLPGQGPNFGLNDLSFPFDGTISASTAYNVWIRTQCGANNSDWVGPYRAELYDDSCAMPSNVAVNRTSGTEVIFTADPGIYDFYIVAEADTAPADIWTGPNAWGDDNVDLSSPYTKTGLDPYVAYDVYVRTQCNASQVSEWVGPYNIPAYACPEPTGVVITRSADNRSATITADVNGSGTFYDVYAVDYMTGIPPTPTTEPNEYGEDDIEFPISKTISPQNQYKVWVRTDCGSSTSEWVGPYFVLLPNACAAPAIGDIDLTRTSPTSAYLTGLDTNFNYQASINGLGQPLRDYPTYGMDNLSIPHTQTTLISPNNAYSVWIRTICAPNTFSEWTGPVTLPLYNTPQAPLKLTPNPVNNGVVKIQGMEATKVQVINLNGRVEINTTVTNNEFNVNGLAPGQYILKATDSLGNTTSMKMVKK